MLTIEQACCNIGLFFFFGHTMSLRGCRADRRHSRWAGVSWPRSRLASSGRGPDTAGGGMKVGTEAR